MFFVLSPRSLIKSHTRSALVLISFPVVLRCSDLLVQVAVITTTSLRLKMKGSMKLLLKRHGQFLSGIKL